MSGSHLRSITELSLRSDDITALQRGDFDDLDSLTELNLYNNKITTLPTNVFEGLSNLTKLDLRANPLKTIEEGTFNGLNSLTELDLSERRSSLGRPYIGALTTIEGGAFKGLSNLKTLDLYNNKITTLPTNVFDGLNSLTSLNLKANPLKTIEEGAFNGLNNLTELDLSERRSSLGRPYTGALTTIEGGAFKGLSNLKTLDLYNNKITTLPTNVFDGLNSLTSLNLKANPLKTIEEDAFNGLNNLTELDLSERRSSLGQPYTGALTTIEGGAFKGLSNLKTLDLYNNKITTLPTNVFEGLSSLTTLNLNRNPGTPFTLTLELVRTDTTDFAAPGPATVVVQLTQGTPFEMTVNLSIEGGTLSATTATITRGKTQSNPITVTESGSGSTTVSLGIAPTVPSGYSGIRMAVGDPLVLFRDRSNRAPLAVGTISSQTLTVGGSDATVNVSSNFRDPDNDNLTYTATSDNTAVATVSVSGAVVTITPKNAGSATVTVTASDSTLTATQTIAVTVDTSTRANRAPLAVGSIPNQTLTVGGSDATVNVSSHFRDPDNDNLTYTATSDSTSVATVSVSGAVVTITPKNAGSATVTVTASDSTLTATQTIAVTVDTSTRANRAPLAVGSISNQTLTVGGSAASVNVSSHFRDPDNDNLTYTATSDNAAVATVSVSGAVVTITPESGGSATVTVTASDSRLTATQDIAVTVEAAPRVAHTLVKISGDNQQGPPGEVLLSLLVVEVRDAESRGLEGIDVTFTVTAGGGSLSERTVTTGPNGQASSRLTLGSNEGENTVNVSAEGISQTVTFTALGANEINIPDRYLRAKIERTLNKRAGDPITAAEMATLTRLDASSSSISDLTGLKFATNLTWLSLYDNNIAILPGRVFAGLSKVTTLHLRSNPLTTIKSGAFNGLSSLTELNLSEMRVKTIEGDAFKGLINLRSLNLFRNNIHTLQTGVFARLSKVTTLHLRSNPLTTIKSGAFNGLSSLTELNLSEMRVKTIEGDAFKGLINLRSLNLFRNNIHTLQTSVFEGLTSLRSLNLNSNPGTRFTLVLELARTDTIDPAAPGPATVVVQLDQGAPFEITVNLSVEGGTLSATTTTIARGKIQSEPITLTQSGTRPATVSLETLPRVPSNYYGIQLAVSDSLSTGSISPHALVKISGDNQQGPTGTTLEYPLIVEVRDAADRGLEGVDVTFAITAGDGSLSSTTVTTGPDGQAASWLTLGGQPGMHTVQASVEGLSQTAVFNATIESMEFDFSVPSGINLIHVPLRVTTVDGVAQTIESISDLYNALGGASTVNFLLTYDSATQGWLSYFGTFDTGMYADTVLTDDTGILAGMRVPVSVRMQGNALGTNERSTITLNQGLNLVGLPLRDSRIVRVSDLLALNGIRGNVPVIILSDNGEFKTVGRAGDAGDAPITGGQAFILTAQRAATVAVSGDGWTNTSETTAAPPVTLKGIEGGDTTPVLTLRGSIADEATGLKVEGFRVTVKNLSSARAISGITGGERGSYQLTVVDTETGRAATIGDILEISAQSRDPLIGVQPLQYTVTAEDVNRSRIQLETLVAYEIPAETELLPNYPNPFNPETWIPYRLAEDAFVTLIIYNLSGQVVRTLEIGHRIASAYENRSKAIYWDGKNELGEGVASGVYSYTLSAGDYSATRKMLILK